MSDSKYIKKLVQLTDYISVAQIFLKSNIWLEKPLTQEHIKDRLLGHWGTCPGINLVYANINRLINKHDDKDFMCVVGPGHGFPAFQANLFVDGSLSRSYSDKIPFTKDGAEEIIINFSTPYGYPSHLNPEAPGVILEGGELGYSLSVAAGSVFDNSKLINVCIIGDGEAETGPLAASWNVNRFINPKSDGVVLPILHLNGYKISGPTMFGRMSNDEISDFFRSHGYSPLFIDSNKDESLAEQSVKIFDTAIQMINTLKTQANSEHGLVAPRWPVIILKTLKGMGAPDIVGDTKIVGNHASHQIVFNDLKRDSENNTKQLKQLEDWLKSYKVSELISFDNDGKVILNADIQKVIPKGGRAIGQSKYAHGKL
ncbi:MAG: phosphoketolase family protein, partial [Candidatus Pacebacteria bacterium]|nr:phosphoketolase family protein [Candidatus Paceibacterota bacterium]